MKNVVIKHVADDHIWSTTLDKAFLEALLDLVQLSKTMASKEENRECALYEYLQKYPSFISNIKEEYKKNVIFAGDYEILQISSVLES